MDKNHSVLINDEDLSQPNRLVNSSVGRALASVAAAAALVSACSASPEINDPVPVVPISGETFESGPATISTSIETLYDSLPSSTKPDIWAEQIFGVLSIAYNEGRKDLLTYAFGGDYMEDSFRRQGALIDSIAERKKDPSRLDSYLLGVEVIPERTDFDGRAGVISVRSYRNFKFVESVAVVDLTVGMHTVDVQLSDGTSEKQELLLIEFWNTVSENISN